MTFHNPMVAGLISDGNYSAQDLSRIETTLRDHGTLRFTRLPSGLFSASPAGASIEQSGYANV
jgi:hypothetical protein